MEILPAIYLQVSNLYNYWLVVSAPLKNMSQLGLLFPIYGKIFQTTNQIIFIPILSGISTWDIDITKKNAFTYCTVKQDIPAKITRKDTTEIYCKNGFAFTCKTWRYYQQKMEIELIERVEMMIYII